MVRWHGWRMTMGLLYRYAYDTAIALTSCRHGFFPLLNTQLQVHVVMYPQPDLQLSFNCRIDLTRAHRTSRFQISELQSLLDS